MKYYGSDTVVLLSKIKEKKLKEKEDKVKEFIPPTLEEIKKYVSDKKLKVDAKSFYDFFTEGKWIDTNGKEVQNWKQKILTWNSYSEKNKKESNGKAEQRDYTTNELDDLFANN